MDGKGIELGNIYIERFWRSLKYEHVYLTPANGVTELYEGVKKYSKFYNNERRHVALGRITPNQMYNEMRKVS